MKTSFGSIVHTPGVLAEGRNMYFVQAQFCHGLRCPPRVHLVVAGAFLPETLRFAQLGNRACAFKTISLVTGCS